jgi:hypothetical protein
MKPDLSRRTKAWVSGLLIVSSIIAIGGMNYISHEDYYFSSPSKRDTLDDLPIIAKQYFKYYHCFWIGPLIVAVWAIIIVLRNTGTVDDLALLAAYTLLVMTSSLIAAAIALYLSNQTLVLNMQDVY